MLMALLIHIISLGKEKLCNALQFDFKDSKNEAKYKAIITKLRMPKALESKEVQIKGDSQLVVSQITSEYQAKGENIKGYFGKTRDLMSQFTKVKVERVPRMENLAKMAYFSATQSPDLIMMKHIPTPSVNLPKSKEVRLIFVGVPWIEHIVRYIKDEELPTDEVKKNGIYGCPLLPHLGDPV